MVSLLMIFGSLAMVGGGVGYFTFPLGLNYGIKSFINLKENGMVFPLYMDPPFGSVCQFSLYTIVNPREVLKGGKMKFDLRGPYVYNVKLLRDNISFVNKGDKVKYDSHRKLVANEEKSANLDEKMWLLNPIVPGVMKTVRSMVLDRLPFQRLSEPIVFNAVNVILDNFKERLIVKTTPRALLDGRKIELLESLSGLAGRFGLSTLIPPGPPQNVFGLAFVQNETVDSMEIWTGVGPNVDKFADVSKWKQKSKMDIWEGKCNIISGTNGELYKPFIEEGKSLPIFLAQMCRTLRLEPADEGLVTLDSGIKAYEYEISPRTFMGARSNPSNRCFCKDYRTYDCQYDGLMSMGPCFFDSPIYFSRGNLHGVDRRIRNTFDDEIFTTKSTPGKASFFLEPITGSVLQANLTLLAIVKILKQPYMRDLAKVQNLTYAPFFAATESITVPYGAIWQAHVLQLMVDYYKPMMIGTAMSGTGLMLFSFFMG